MRVLPVEILIIATTTTAALIAPPIVERQLAASGQLWPQTGRYTGKAEDPPDYCGDGTGFSLAARADCDQANAQWDWRWIWDPRWGRQSQVVGGCVLVWHPGPGLLTEIFREYLQTAFTQLLDACPDGTKSPYVGNYAYHRIDDSAWVKNWGTVSVYYKNLEPDA